jgi:hypothetical protein
LCYSAGTGTRIGQLGRGATESNALIGFVALGDGDLTTAERRLRAAAAVQRAVGDPVWLVISVGCLCR